MATLKAAEIKPGTTPLLSVTVEGEDIHEATVYVTIDDGGRQVVKSNYDHAGDFSFEIIDDGVHVDTLVNVQYSQSETLMLRPGNAKIEVGWVFDDGSADKTNIGRLRIPKTLFYGVMRYHG